ncbi:MAG TPA: hypothetical protein VJ794_02125, partial [Gemmatimonadales bacterium]|nr:hypothetical protein [Gemmatimonadales bacterium]
MRSIPSRSLGLFLAASLLPACHSWRIPDVPLAEAIANHPDAIRITRHDATRVTLTSPRLSGDTLIGLGRASRVEAPVTVPLSDVLAIEVLRFDGGKTVRLVAGVGATAILIAAAVSGGSDGDDADDGGNSGGGGGYYSCPLVYSWDGTR